MPIDPPTLARGLTARDDFADLVRSWRRRADGIRANSDLTAQARFRDLTDLGGEFDRAVQAALDDLDVLAQRETDRTAARLRRAQAAPPEAVTHRATTLKPLLDVAATRWQLLMDTYADAADDPAGRSLIADTLDTVRLLLEPGEVPMFDLRWSEAKAKVRPLLPAAEQAALADVDEANRFAAYLADVKVVLRQHAQLNHLVTPTSPDYVQMIVTSGMTKFEQAHGRTDSQVSAGR